VLLADDVLWIFLANSDVVVVFSTLIEWSLIHNIVVIFHEFAAQSPNISSSLLFFIEYSEVAVSSVETQFFRFDQKVRTGEINNEV